MATDPTFIVLLGEKHGITLPPFAEREELAVAWSDARARSSSSSQLRVAAATLGLCTRLGRRAGADYTACKCDVLAYGGKVYSWLREQGASPKDVKLAGDEAIVQVSNTLAPREPEVAAQADFSEAGGAGST